MRNYNFFYKNIPQNYNFLTHIADILS